MCASPELSVSNSLFAFTEVKQRLQCKYLDGCDQTLRFVFHRVRYCLTAGTPTVYMAHAMVTSQHM